MRRAVRSARGKCDACGHGSLGELRPVVVGAATLERGSVLDRAAIEHDLEERRVPAAFTHDALGLPAEALGRRVDVTLPAGSYLTASSP